MAVDRFQLTVEAMTRGEQDLARLENAVNRFSAAADRAGKGSSSMGSSFEATGAKIKDALANPMGAAQQAVDGLLGKLGPLGGAIGATAAVAAATGVAIFSLAKSFGDLYEQQSNNAIRLGVTVREYGLLDRVSKEAGLSGDALVGTMRGLSKALADNGEEGSAASNALRRLGVTGTDAFGAVRPMRDLLLDIADKLGGIQNPAERAEIAMKVLGRSGLEVLPMMNSELRQQIELMEKSGAGWTASGEIIGKAADKMADKFDRWLDSTVKGTKAFAALLAIAATDRDAYYAYAREERIANEQRFGVYTLAPQLPNATTAKGPNFFPNMTDAQLAAVRRTDAQSQIRQFMGADPKTRLSGLQSELKRTIDEAAGPEDVARVRDLSAQIRGLEASIKAAEEAAKRSDKLRQYTADVLQFTLMQPGRANATGFNLLRGNGFMTYNAPSLLRSGESVNRGTIGSDPALLEAANQRNLEAMRATVEYQVRRNELLAGPGGEIAAVREAAAIRLQSLEQQKALGLTIFEYDKQRLQITRDAELQILQIQRQRQEANRQTGASIFDSLLSGGAGIKGYASSLGLGIARTASGNAYDMFAGGLGGRLSTTKDPNSFLGRLFAGTPLGVDPAGAVQLSAGRLQFEAGTKMLAAASMMGGGGGGTFGGTGSIFERTLGWLAPSGTYASSIKGGAFSSSDDWTNYGANIYGPEAKAGMGGAGRTVMGIGAGVGAAFGTYSGIRQGGARGALTTAASLAGGAAAILPMLSKTLSLAGPIGGAIAIGATLALAFMPDPKETRRRALEEQARQRQYEEAVGTEYMSDLSGRSVDYGKRGDVRVYLSMQAMDAQSIIDRQEDIGEAVRQALSSYPPLAMDIKGATLGV
jgi:hypothetical protein